MTELWDIAAHVEKHPDDYPQRWRLAKKLYEAREYRLALEHLNVLKNEWTPKLNVRRYLAATHFRLGRYPEAIATLEESIAEWPEEIGVREQLAYVLKADKRLEEALDAWEQVLRLQPDHAIAQKSVRKLNSLIAGDGETQESKFDFAFGPEEDVPASPPMPGIKCPKCGAQNSEEFSDCWRCGSPLSQAGLGAPQQDAFNLPQSALPVQSEILGRITVLATLGLLLCALFFGIRLILRYNEGAPHTPALSQIYDYDLVPSRFMAGLLMLLLWPVVLRITVLLLRASPRPKFRHAYLSGTFLGAFALTMLLLPMPASLLIPAGSILLSLVFVVVVTAFQMHMGAALVVWAVHFIVMLLLGAGAFWTTEIYRYDGMLNPVAEIAALRQFARVSGKHTGGRPARLPTTLTPIRDKVQWRSAGSAWLDDKTSQIVITLRLEEETPGLRFQIYENRSLRFHEDIGENRNEVFYYDIAPGNEYEFVITGADNLIIQTLIQSILPFDFLE